MCLQKLKHRQSRAAAAAFSHGAGLFGAGVAAAATMAAAAEILLHHHHLLLIHKNYLKLLPETGAFLCLCFG